MAGSAVYHQFFPQMAGIAQKVGEIYGGSVLYPNVFAFKDGQANFIETLRSSDHLMRMID